LSRTMSIMPLLKPAAIPQHEAMGHATLLVIDPSNSECLTERSNPPWLRLAVRLRASSLDRRLAQGDSPESSRLLAARAQVLVSPANLTALAGCWENVLRQSHRSPAARDPRARLNRGCIVACETEIERLVDALMKPRPVTARGVASAALLLADGTGPLCDRSSRSDELAVLLRGVVGQLDSTYLSYR
jgi:hypothetical protein